MMREEIKKRYTRVVKVGGKWRCDFQVGVQGFTVCECETRREAVWFADMLAITIENLIAEVKADNA
jgi:hypothetical protein